MVAAYLGQRTKKIPQKCGIFANISKFLVSLLITGGWGGIRTPGGLAPSTVFKTVAIDRSATHPKLYTKIFYPIFFKTQL